LLLDFSLFSVVLVFLLSLSLSLSVSFRFVAITSGYTIRDVMWKFMVVGMVVRIRQGRWRAWLGFLVLFWVLVRKGMSSFFSLSKFQPTLSLSLSLSPFYSLMKSRVKVENVSPTLGRDKVQFILFLLFSFIPHLRISYYVFFKKIWSFILPCFTL
jgi:hypothetical protein